MDTVTVDRKPPARRRALGKLLHLSFLLSRPMTLGARIAAFDADGRVMLVRHTYVPGWHFPGGGVEPGETAEAAALREFIEEANGVPGAPASLHGFYFNNRASRRDHVALFVARNASQSAPKRADREIEAAAFFPLADMPEGTSRAVHERLAEICGLAPLSPFW
jgi:8-oxo-dGTP pyrophosphatase MutT (NUDIX family)